MAVTLSVGAADVAIGSARTHARHAAFSNLERETWVWSFHKPSSLIVRAKHADVGNLLVWVSPEFTRNHRERERLQRLSELASHAGIALSALSGDPSWAVHPGVAGAWAAEVRRSHLFHQIHLDVEPQGLLGTHAEQTAATVGLLRAVKRVRAAGLPLDVDIPYWYDRLRTPAGYGLDKAVMRLASRVTLMSYQNTARKVLRVSGPEMDDAQRLGVPARIGVNLAPATTDAPTSTMYGLSHRMIRTEVREVQRQAVRRWSGFAGITIHDSEYLGVFVDRP